MNSETTLKAVELAHKILQDNIVDNAGHLAYDDKFFEGLDQLLKKLNETRNLAEAMR